MNTVDDAFTFVGILAHPFDLPGYVAPVFEDSTGQRFTQIPDEDERIAEFAAISMPEWRLLPVNSFPQIQEGHSRVWSRAPGNPLLLAFMFPDDNVLLGESDFVRRYLADHVSAFEGHPAVQAVVAEYCGVMDVSTEARRRASMQEDARRQLHDARRGAFEETSQYLKSSRGKGATGACQRL